MTAMRRGLSRAYACAARPNLRTTKENDSSFFGAIAGASARSKTFPPMSEAYAGEGSTDDGRGKVDASNATPTTRVTTLANGATIASEDAFGATTAVGVGRA